MAAGAFTFVHTADWQMGMGAVGLGAAAERVRAERLAAAAQVVEVARRHRADCLVLAGDLFEHNGVDQLLVQRVADVLRQAPCPVFILPGNHDPLVAGSVYEREVWARTPGVTVWRRPEPFPFEDGVSFFPCPTRSRGAAAEVTAWIPPREPGDASIRIGVAHGSLRGWTAAEDESAAPVEPEAALRLGLDYLALGHWHSTLLVPASADGRVHTAYAGTHEATRFGERDSGNVLVVEIPQAGGAARVTPVRTGRLLWRQERRDLLSAADCMDLLRTFDGEDPEQAARTLLDLRLRGVVPADALAQLERELEPLLTARFLYARLDMDALRLEPSEAEILSLAPAGPVRVACERLLEQARAATDARARTVARHALAELYALAREVGA